MTKEAKELGKQSFNYAFLLDQNPEEVGSPVLEGEA